MSKNSTQSESLHITIPKQINSDLEDVQEKTGLNKSEIARRGLINEIDKLR